MSVVSWIRALRDRPIAAHERRAALTVIAVLCIAVTLLLALSTPTQLSSSRSWSRGAAADQHRDQAASDKRALTQDSERAAEVFLGTYLPYLYGHCGASEVRGATVAFADSLASQALRVPPAMRAEHARVVSLHAAPAQAGLLSVTALVNDGGLVDYPIALLLARQGHRLLVAGLAGA
jgi:hypothetical protein